jgi:hypothetical protein
MSRLLKLALALFASSITVIALQAVPAHASASSGPSSAIVGELGVEGGAYPGPFRPTSGTVEVEFNSVPLALVKHVGKSGKFEIRLSPGSYTVSGCGPGASGNRCSQSQDIKLVSGEIDHIQLVWAYLP